MKKFFYLLGTVFVVLILSGYLVFFLPSKLPKSLGLQNSESISAVVLPHFDFAKEDRQNMLKDLALRTNPQQILLVSVNHFNSGQGDIITTKKNWDLSDSKVNPSQDLFNVLVDSKIVASNDEAFLNEHGIKNVLPDVAKAFPNANILPVIIRDTASKEEVEKLSSAVFEKYPDCLLVSSIDFSHYNQSSLSKIHDVLSLSALNDQSLDEAWVAETDSPQNLYLNVSWAKKHAGQYFNEVLNSNNGEVQKNDSLETTSYILGYYSQTKPPQKTEDATTFLFGGDLMLDRLVYHNFKDKGLEHIFDDFGPRVFWGTNISAVNLEGPISQTPIDDNISANNLNFNFPPETKDVLQFLHINEVSLANNHTSNAGVAGFQTTQKILNDAGISYTGNGNTFDDSSITRFKTKIPISLVAVNFLSNPSLSKIEDAIKSEKQKGQFVIVFPHWGNEYQTKHSSTQQSEAYGLIDAGADVILGSHPHVVEDMEVYKGKPIIYSMGNFVFDQQFSRLTEQGLLVGGKITSDSLELSFFPTISTNLMPQFMVGQEKQNAINILLSGQSGFDTLRSDTIKLSR